MVDLVKNSLPTAVVCCCAVAEGQTEIIDALQQRGVTVAEVPAHDFLPVPVQTHADLQLYLLPDGRILVIAGAPVLAQRLQTLGFAVDICAEYPGDVYPQDVPLCCFALRDKLYGLPQAVAGELRAQYAGIIPVRQGYARCSTCLVDAGSIITADRDIAQAARKNGIEVLQIRPGYILLPGYDYGFIGGCCGLIAPNTLAVTGDIDTHPDAMAIRMFCAQRGVQIDCLVPGPLRDIGGLLPLQQKKSLVLLKTITYNKE